MPVEIEKQHIKRTRSLWSKTFGVAFKTLHAKGDLYHANYLLQDCYVALRAGKKPVLGHAHGSDLRATLNHHALGRIVRHNLMNCGKIVVSTPDILNIAKQHRADSVYLPNPVDAEFFHPKPIEERKDKTRVLIASDSNWAVKRTNIAIKALSTIKKEVEVSIIRQGKDFEKTIALASSLGLNLNILPRASHTTINKYYWEADVVIDRFALGSLGMVSLEAISCGRPVLSYVSSEYHENADFPLRDLRDEEAIAETIKNLPKGLWKEEYNFVQKHHNINQIEEYLLQIYKELTIN